LSGVIQESMSLKYERLRNRRVHSPYGRQYRRDIGGFLRIGLSAGADREQTYRGSSLIRNSTPPLESP